MNQILKQFKYAFKHGATLRYTVFGIVFAINVVFGLLAYFGILGFAAAVTAVSLSGVGLGAVIIVNIIAGIINLNNVLCPPTAYANALVPVKSGKVLFARLVAIIAQDLITMVLCIFGVVWLSFYLAGITTNAVANIQVDVYTESVTASLFGCAMYAYIYMFAVFCYVLNKSIFFNKKCRAIFTIGAGIATFWLISLLDFTLIPFATVDNWFIFYNITLHDALGTAIHGVVTAVKITILFVVTSRLMDRRMNY